MVGDDYPVHELERLAARGIDWAASRRATGEIVPLEGEVLLRPAEPRDAGDPARRLRRLRAQAAARRRATPSSSSSATSIPVLQLGVLDQVKAPQLVRLRHDELLDPVASATTLLELLKRVDMLMVNDTEARELSGDWNIHRAGRWILERGPEARGDQAGRIRRAADRAGPHLPRPGLSAGRGLRSDRRGRRLRRRLHGLSRAGRRRSTRRTCAARWCTAPTMGSYSVSGVRHPRIRGRHASPTSSSGCASSCDLTHVPLAEPDRDVDRSTPRPASISTPPRTPRRGSAQLVAGTRTPLSVGRSRRVRRHGARAAGHAEAGAGDEHRWRRHQGARGAAGRALRHRGRRSRQPFRERHPGARRPADRVHGLHRRAPAAG